MDDPETSAQIRPVPAPWKLTSEAYVFPVSSLAVLPKDAYNLLESESNYASEDISGKIYGGIGKGWVMIVRYNSSPARRLNWNIPKHRAEFSFEPLSPGSRTTKLTVSRPSSSESSSAHQFFSVLCMPVPYLPSFPVNTKHLPFMDFTLTHPPVPQSQSSIAEVGTEEWRSDHDDIKILIKVCNPWSCPPRRNGRTKIWNGADFPDIKPRDMAFYLTDVELEYVHLNW
ncbi:hypothetical protein M422DRAFT_263381 [Sphaerobolus stellatus SS14]|uniref:Uncharacterized protein n=1 Tax=Sphaerobolus stellatus (strain SS14) TaxID=990650 RepID=A0A0C9UZ70_SPHS4|nr:hypothetical protein M422DRAFT_263381 [Sphaerobolus stellatus SS14]